MAPTLQTEAVKVRDLWDLIGTQLTSMTTDPQHLTTFMRALGENPQSLVTGIPVAMLPGMEAQADALGMVRLGPGSLGNREIASTMPIIRAGADVFRTMANQMEDDWDAAYRTGGPNPITPDAFKEQYWNRSILATAAAYYGADEKNIVTLLLDEQAHWQRKFAAETKLNFNPGAWVKNFLTGNVTGLVEGAGSLAPTDDYRATMQGAYNLQGPWAGAGRPGRRSHRRRGLHGRRRRQHLPRHHLDRPLVW